MRSAEDWAEEHARRLYRGESSADVLRDIQREAFDAGADAMLSKIEDNYQSGDRDLEVEELEGRP